MDALFFSAVGAAENRAAGLDAVANDFTAAMTAFGREHMNGALEAVEIMRNSVHQNFQGLVILIATTFACGAAVAVHLANGGFLGLSVVLNFPS